MQLSKVSDSQIREEYQRRFTLKVGTKINDAERASDHLRKFILDPARETFIVLFLNANNCVMNTEILFQGTLTSAVIYPREIIRKVLENEAGAILLCHNHPSGNLNPSKEDISITRKIKEACDTIDVSIHDHLILAGNGYYSFADHGHM